ncbi:MAG: hypothetical protein FJZ67_11780 [Bacteroidetes bacterium]|nr:hypothetical protein [Bacteroidota bacterium]
MKVYRAYLFLILLLLTACSKSNSNMFKGKLHDYTGLDGCGMLIDLDNGTTLEPINLSHFQDNVNLVDGQKVWVKYNEISAGSICMVGKVVEIDELENR